MTSRMIPVNQWDQNTAVREDLHEPPNLGQGSTSTVQHHRHTGPAAPPVKPAYTVAWPFLQPELCLKHPKTWPGSSEPDLAHSQGPTSCTASLTPWIERASWVRRWRIRLLCEASFPPLSNKPLPLAIAKAATCRSKRNTVKHWAYFLCQALC